MILLDANLLLYAYDAGSPAHVRVRGWLESAFQAEEVGIGLTTLLAFIRIGTSPAVFDRPLSAAEATEIVSGWLRRPNVGVVQPTGRHWDLLGELARTGQARGPLLMDAHLAALALEHGATLCTSDRDFSRFPGLRIEDPLGE